MNDKRQMETLASFTHGALATLHCLGMVYNLTKKQYGHAAIHFLVMAYDAYATHHHAKEL